MHRALEDRFAFGGGSAGITEQARRNVGRELLLDVRDAFFGPLALLDDLRDALGDGGRPAAEDRGGAGERGVGGREVMDEARAA